MFIKAIYEPTKEKCYVNTDYIVDLYTKVGRYLAYTFDNERGGYLIDKAEFDSFSASDET